MTQQPAASAPAEDLLDLWPEVLARRAAFLRAIDVTEAQARRKIAGKPEEWCVLEVAQHVLGWTENVADVIEAIAAGRPATKHPRGYIPPGPPDTIVEVRHALVRASMRFATLPQRLPVHPDAERTVAHEVYGPLNYRGWFARSAAHDLDHTGQVEALRREVLGGSEGEA